jgi:DNA-binding NarL/FixJ family response regulator
MGSMAWTVLIVDDHAGFRAGARALLEAEGFDVLGEAADGQSAVEQARRLRPQVVLLDVQLPGIDGFAVAERLAAEPAAPAVVLISSRGQGAFRKRLEATPARGFITKAEFSGECLTSLLA